jgi:hypothetical protein
MPTSRHKSKTVTKPTPETPDIPEPEPKAPHITAFLVVLDVPNYDASSLQRIESALQLTKGVGRVDVITSEGDLADAAGYGRAHAEWRQRVMNLLQTNP